MNEQAQKAFLKKHPDFLIKSAADLKISNLKPISTGSISLDLALGVPLPYGITEFAGGKGVGKTTIALESAYNAWKSGFEVHYLNIERSVNELSLAGIRWTEEEKKGISILYPSNAEAALDYIETELRAGKNKFFILDSVAALVSEKAMAESAGKEFMALIARLLSSWLPKAATLLERHESVLLLVNQLRDSLSPYTGPYVTPGGKSKDFYSNEQVFFRTNKASRLTGSEADEYTGHIVTAEVTKNRFAPPYKKATFPIFYLPGPHIDRYYEVAQLSVDFGLVQKGGAWITLQDETKIQGMPSYVSHLRENEELYNSTKAELMELIS